MRTYYDEYVIIFHNSLAYCENYFLFQYSNLVSQKRFYQICKVHCETSFTEYTSYSGAFLKLNLHISPCNSVSYLESFSYSPFYGKYVYFKVIYLHDALNLFSVLRRLNK